MRVSAEQVKSAMEAANIRYVEHHDCSLCGYMTNFQIGDDGALYFDHGCHCSMGGMTMRAATFEEAADWINMQTSPAVAKRLAAKFGLAE